MKDFLKISFMILSGTIVFALNIFVFIKFWEWFIMPIFSIEMIGFPQALGLLLFVELFKYKKTDTDDDYFEWYNLIVKFSVNIFYCILLLLSGYLITFI